MGVAVRERNLWRSAARRTVWHWDGCAWHVSLSNMYSGDKPADIDSTSLLEDCGRADLGVEHRSISQ